MVEITFLVLEEPGEEFEEDFGKISMEDAVRNV
jgi:hypothetical protein